MEHICRLAGDKTRHILPPLHPNATSCQKLARKFQEMITIDPCSKKCNQFFGSLKSPMRIEMRRHIKSSYFYIIHPLSKIGDTDQSPSLSRSKRCIVVQKQSVGYLGELDYYDYGENATETPPPTRGIYAKTKLVKVKPVESKKRKYHVVKLLNTRVEPISKRKY
ncbi:uncharacterized protein isoform X1 [Leptinotarsa decemlineata]|uniref:uncharacterized protein isoform X1 n=1 Tax=Leptinotarsa decemlineata TaxID=7539 RepID=UPI003D30B5FB